MEDASEDPTIFTAHSLPSDPRLLATVTNAYLGTRVYHDALHVSGVYNGVGEDTHRAVLPSPLNVRLEAPAGTGEQLTETFALDTGTGSFLHTLEGPSFRASQCIYAHRTLPRVLAFSVSIARRTMGREPVTVLLRSAFSPESPDLDLHLGPDFQGARYLYGHTLTPEQPGGPRQEVHMLWTPAPPALTLGEGEEDGTWDFLTVVGSSQAEARACLTEAMQLQAGGALYSTHTRAWARLWAGCGLDVAGPLPLRQALRGSLYYLLSALPQPEATGYICHGLSPGGLSNGSRGECYWGHVFWDQELWMFPLVLMLHPEAARAILEYRVRTLGGALQNARNLGYQGAKFAWESAGSGLEVCPEDIYGTQEIHVNGAVVLAFELYYHATQDLQLFREAGGWDVVSAVAEFWCSRVEWSPGEEKYHLRGVMPPDEYHAGVNNSVYTNVLAQNSLRFAAALAWDLGLPVPNRWLEVADKIKVPFDLERNFHPEFDGYEPGEQVKQADVVLLGYPVPFPLSPNVRRRNLEVYEAVTSPQGPAMTWSMFAVGWMELKEPARARDLLDRSFANAAEPFKVWTENADGSGAVNFLTGMGGFLQAVLFGCTGFRVTRAGVTFDPMCLAGVPRVWVSGVSYQGNKLNFSFSEDSVTVEMTAQAGPRGAPLEAELWPSRARLPLRPGNKISFARSAGRIQRSALQLPASPGSGSTRHLPQSPQDPPVHPRSLQPCRVPHPEPCP
ncbi:PREDICTED: acid trehalase-like protein 1 isoform X1 [Propithecus coquereli]|uniref:acid trehalase-like protein 1 isoform X1 n=2 Tax=Propithecus coquereli TaxID=379532 RepID=UPI00063F5D84|nr:PREDICTED: acid trehalase-like protein 1 isoform X1 [Propithecus coquereli]XP_012507443.1 PREDICTED: acid trehalase-like protein 1 isoform X1 [Propithecus coquereli]